MRYKTIADHIVDDIKNNRLALGSKMPSLRVQANNQGTSLTTAISAYRLLEERGWLVAKPQSGFYVSSPMSQREQPPMPVFKSRIKVAPTPHYGAQNTQSDPRFGVAQLAEEQMPLNAFQRSLKRVMNQAGTSLHSYPCVQGEERLRTTLALHFSHYGIAQSADDLVITNGCMNAIFYALQVCTQPGDCVAISSPCFTGLLDLLSQMGRNVVEVPCVEEGIDIAQLEQLIQNNTVQAALLSCNHINPLGISLSSEQKQRLAKLANHYQFPIIEDDVYLELAHNKRTPLPAKYWDKNGDILWCGSFSKTLSAALRVGWCAAGKYQTKMLQTFAASQMGVNKPTQLALANFIDSGQYHNHLSKTRTFLRLNIEHYRRFLTARLPSNTLISAPQGGLVLWLYIPHLDTHALKQHCDRKNIQLRVGTEFSSRKLYEHYIRISCGWTLQNDTEQRLEQLCELIKQHLSPQ